MMRAIILLFLIPLSLAIGISPPDAAITYEPGAEIEGNVRIINARNLEIPAMISAEGFLEGNIEFDEEEFLIPAKSSKTIKYRIRLPEDMEPGPHTGYITIKDNKKYGGGSFAIAVSVKQTIKTFVSYPGKYAILSVNVENVNEGESARYSASIQNKGSEAIRNGTLELEVSSDQEVVESQEIEGLSVLPDTTHNLKNKLGKLEKGAYTLNARFIYDKEAESSDEFFVGSYEVLLSNHSDRLFASEITPFHVKLKSNWNGNISNVYASLILKGKEYKTQPITLSAFKEIDQIIYVDDMTLEAGEKYNTTLIVHFENQSYSREMQLEAVKRVSEEGPSVVNTVSITLAIVLILLLAAHLYISRKK
ncbi:MAG: hypothetical protein R6V53_01405 [Candidatus Woesearchaeota archaeon]